MLFAICSGVEGAGIALGDLILLPLLAKLTRRYEVDVLSYIQRELVLASTDERSLAMVVTILVILVLSRLSSFPAVVSKSIQPWLLRRWMVS